MGSFFMQFYTDLLLAIQKISTLHIEYSSRIVKHSILYLQKIRRIFIKVVDMRTIIIKCE